MAMTMDANRLSVLLGTCIVPSVLALVNSQNLQEIDAFYRSKLYALLSDEKTGMWHLSPRTLADLYEEERKTGSFDPPEEQS